MSLIFLESFDDGLQSSKWSAYTMGTSATARTGPRSGDFSGAGTAQFAFPVASADATIFFGFAFNGTPPSGSGRRHMRIFGDTGGTAHLGFVFRNSTGAVEVYRGGSFSDTLIASSAAGVVPASTWTHIEVKCVLSDSVGIVQVKVNGVQVINFSGDTRNGGTVVKFDKIWFGTETTDPANYLCDDLFILNSAGSVNNTFIGDCTVLARFPDGNGNYSQGTNSGGTSVNNYTYVDENPSPNTSDYVAFAATGDKDTYTFADIPTGTVYGVQQAAYAAKSDAGARTIRNIQRIAGTDYASAVDQGLSVTPTYVGKYDIMEVSPATGVLWTVAEINAAEFGTEARP